MTRQNYLVLLILFVISGAAAARDYDLYANTRYPEPGRRPEVELYKVNKP